MIIELFFILLLYFLCRLLGTRRQGKIAGRRGGGRWEQGGSGGLLGGRKQAAGAPFEEALYWKQEGTLFFKATVK
jgi:hypothetical protein